MEIWVKQIFWDSPNRAERMMISQCERECDNTLKCEIIDVNFCRNNVNRSSTAWRTTSNVFSPWVKSKFDFSSVFPRCWRRTKNKFLLTWKRRLSLMRIQWLSMYDGIFYQDDCKTSIKPTSIKSQEENVKVITKVSPILDLVEGKVVKQWTKRRGKCWKRIKEREKIAINDVMTVWQFMWL